MSKSSDNNADQIRRWVADNFNDVGPFRTGDVADEIKGAVDVKASGNISAALQTWVDHQRIVNGLKLRRTTEKGKTAIWEVYPAKPGRQLTEASVEKPVAIAFNETKLFSGEIVDQRKSPSGAFLVMSDGKVYKVELLKY